MAHSFIHIYCGDGKGKTTAAVGSAVRAAGRGKNVLMTRFLKTEDSGEVPVLRAIPGITVRPCVKTFGFYSQMTREQRREAARYFSELFETTWELAAGGSYDLLILDEIMAACQFGFVQEERLLTCLAERPEGLEVILTGRNPSERLLKTADYVSEICKRQHPFDKGIAAREGIEY